MARPKKSKVGKEPVRLREKKLTNGSTSLYLDIYKDGVRKYDFLKLYLVPETSAEARQQNQNTLQAANAIKSQTILALANNQASIKNYSGRSKMLLTDWMVKFAEHREKVNGAPSSLKMVEAARKHLENYRPNARLKDIDKEFVLSFVEYLKNCKTRGGKVMDAATVKSYFVRLNAALNYAVKQDVIPENPIRKLDGADRPKWPESKREHLTATEVKRLMVTPCKGMKDAVKTAFLFSCFCGLRWSDVRDLQWKNVQRDGDKVFVSLTMKKTKTSLIVPLSAEALEYMPERGTASDEDRVFAALSSDVYANKLLRDLAEAAGISKKVTFHVARHTFATLCLTADVDIYTVSKLLGHTNVNTTQIYAKVVNKKKDEAVNAVSRLFAAE